MNRPRSRNTLIQSAIAICVTVLLTSVQPVLAQTPSSSANGDALQLTQAWDKPSRKAIKSTIEKSRSKIVTASPWLLTCICRKTAATSGWPRLLSAARLAR